MFGNSFRLARSEQMNKVNIKIEKATSWHEAIKKLMDLRESGFWSFRGQRDHSWQLGLHHPVNFTENDLRKGFMQFRKRCLEFTKPTYIDEHHKWRWLFFAQHYRLRTRLLDWTSNPLVALYFAVENILTDKSTIKTNPYGAVWAIRVRDQDFQTEEQLESVDPDKVIRWLMINPPPVTSRMIRQSARFSFHPECDAQPLDTIPRRYNEETLVKVIVGDPENQDTDNPADDIREKLGIMNVHHASLFPDPDGVAAFINNEWPAITTQVSTKSVVKSTKDAPTA